MNCLAQFWTSPWSLVVCCFTAFRKRVKKTHSWGFFHLVFHSWGELSHLPSWVNDKYPWNPSSKGCPRVREVAHNSNDCWIGVIAIANEGYKPTNITSNALLSWSLSNKSNGWIIIPWLPTIKNRWMDNRINHDHFTHYSNGWLWEKNNLWINQWASQALAVSVMSLL